jgi:hypothetical protein
MYLEMYLSCNVAFPQQVEPEGTRQHTIDKTEDSAEEAVLL